MKISDLFREYVWLVNTIYQAGRITLEEINTKWIQTDMSGGVKIPRTTFHRHRIAIEDIFGLYIECEHKGGNHYYIGNAEVLEEDSVQNWLLSTLSVNHVISESISIQDRILLESIPSSTGCLEQIIQAMKQKRLITIQYLKYGADEAKAYRFAPYCIKLYHRRWYVLGRLENLDYRIFSFDRIKELTITDDAFTLDKEFKADKYFRDCYGIVKMDDVPVERIVLRAFDDECYYLRDLPIHQSQVEIGGGDGYTDFEYHVSPTLDFCGQILSRGGRLKVLSPESLATKIQQMLASALKNYAEK